MEWPARWYHRHHSLAESHLAIHTWPESRRVTLDVYVCNFTEDNTAKAEQLFDALTLAFARRDRW